MPLYTVGACNGAASLVVEEVEAMLMTEGSRLACAQSRGVRFPLLLDEPII